VGERRRASGTTPGTAIRGPEAARPHGRLRVALETLGCRVNFSETDRLRGTLVAAGYHLVDFRAEADVYVVNTCTVTHVADRKSRQLLRRAVRNNPEAIVVAVGCYADTASEVLRQVQGVDLVLSQHEEPHLVERLAAVLAARGLEPPAGGVPDHPLFPANPARALIKVQDGCDNRCAYCIVRVARGASRSRPAGEILDEIRAVEQAGYPEIILTGINLGVYRDAHTGDLTALARRILRETGIGRIRFSSIEPQDFPAGLLDLWPEPRLCRHFHLPVQSGCDRTLARMGRLYRWADFRALVEQIQARLPDAGLTTDIIVGFPGETAADFAASAAAIAALPFSGLHVFPFSSRPGTAAAAMAGAVSPDVVRARCAETHALAAELGRAFRERFIGRELAVLWDGRSAQGWTGLSDNYLRVGTACREPLLAQVTPTRIAGVEGEVLVGNPDVPVGAGDLVKSPELAPVATGGICVFGV
jgi:threonylcarbamoyladenosine tRNA methylthiotransferase MtaB